MTQRHFTEGEELLFITTNTLHRVPYFARPGYAKETIDTLYRVQELHPFFLYGFVIMPDHIHLLARFPSPYSVSRFMSVYKSGLTFNIGIPKLWQSRYFLTSPNRPWCTLQYIYMNPVKAGLVEHPHEYPWSSASGKWDVSQLG